MKPVFGPGNKRWLFHTFTWFGLGGRIRLRLIPILVSAATLAATAQSAPQLTSVTPTDGATGVATNSMVVFVFDQDMDIAKRPFPSIPPLLVGNFDFEP